MIRNRPGFQAALALAAAAGLAFTACDDDNLFRPGEAPVPELIEFTLPDRVDAGQTMDVRVRYTSESPIDLVQLRLRGAFSQQLDHPFEDPGTPVVVDFFVTIPASVTDTLLVVSVVARNTGGRISPPVSDTVRIADTQQPSVSASLENATVGLGKEGNVTVSATDNVGLSALGFRLLGVADEGAAEDTILSELVQVAGSNADSTFAFTVPDTLEPRDLVVEGFALDVEGNEGAGRATQVLRIVFIDDVPPTAEIVDPVDGAAHPVGDSLLVSVDLEDNGGITRVSFQAISERGDPNLGTDTIVTKFEPKTVEFDPPPADTLLQRWLQPTGDTIREDVVLIATATDIQGNVTTDTVSMILGGPRLSFLNVVDGDQVRADQDLSVRVEAFDRDGLRFVDLVADGSVADSLRETFGSPPDTVVTLEFIVSIPGTARGEFTLRLGAENTLGTEGIAGPITLEAIEPSATDGTPPTLFEAVTAEDRMEFTDSLGVEISGRDDTQGSGVAKVGYTVLAISEARGDTLATTDSLTFSPTRTGTVLENFRFAPFNVDTAQIPDTLIFEVTAWMIDGAGNCAAATSTAQDQQFSCGTLGLGGETFRVASGLQGLRVTTAVVSGQTVLLPAGGFIADAVVDPDPANRPLLVLSNIERDRLEIFDLSSETFGRAVPVGSEPWGVAFSRTDPDTLFVANSGGTNVSKVFMASDDPEDPARGENVLGRIQTPNTVLFEVTEAIGDGGNVTLNAEFFGFSDRPQFVAQDSTGRILYSTKPTSVDQLGTIRVADPTVDTTEVRLFFEHGEVESSDETVAIARVDSLTIFPGALPGGNDAIQIFDHVLGSPNTIIASDVQPLGPAIDTVAARGSDIFAVRGTWVIESIGLSDTTFVSGSTDGGWVAFGEGATGPTGRIMMWNAADSTISDVMQVEDLVGNAAERVFGVSLNHDGSMGVARGSQGYFFTPNLRLQGVADLPSGGAGAALHPLHGDGPVATDPNVSLAFVSTGERTVDIIDTRHFFRLGRVFIRDVVSGPLKASLPFPSDNVGLSCLTTPVTNGSGQVIGDAVEIYSDDQGDVPYPPDGPTDDRCIVLKLYGVTSAGGVVVIDVTKADILREHPARQ